MLLRNLSSTCISTRAVCSSCPRSALTLGFYSRASGTMSCGSSVQKTDASLVSEGPVNLRLSASHKSPCTGEAFYNPRMRVGRDLVLCSLAVLKEENTDGPITCLDGFAASGVTGLRWLLELDSVSPSASSASCSTPSSSTSDGARMATVPDNDMCSVSSETPSSASGNTDNASGNNHPASQCAKMSDNVPPRKLAVTFCDINPIACRTLMDTCQRHGVEITVETSLNACKSLSAADETAAPATGNGDTASCQDAAVEPPAKRHATDELPCLDDRCNSDNKDSSAPTARAHLYCCDLSLLLHTKPFQFIHLDPFGSCAPYLDTVFRRCPKGGVVALTCTDVPALFGCPPRVAARNYNGIQLRRTPIKRELAARVVLASATLSAARSKKAVTPLFVLAKEHFVLVVMRINRGYNHADAAVNSVQRLIHCVVCRENVFIPSECRADHMDLPCQCSKENSGVTWIELGPVWSGALFNKSFTSDMERLSQGLAIAKDSRAILQQLQEAAAVEAEAISTLGDDWTDTARPSSKQAAFYLDSDFHTMPGYDTPRTADVLDALRKKGCLACKCSSHGNKLIKSNASVEEFRSAILTVAKPSA